VDIGTICAEPRDVRSNRCDRAYCSAAAGALAVGAGGAATGAIWTGRFAAGGRFTAATAGARAVGGGAAPPAGLDGSADMMLTGGVDDALGNSALVGLPVGIDDGNDATRPAADGWAAGAFQDDA
jgi:hypothetical protein